MVLTIATTLVEMGISRNAALRSAHFTGARNVESALQWYLEHSHDKTIDQDFDPMALPSVPSATAAMSDSGSDSASDDGFAPYKMVLVVRTDLKMTSGKIAAQCCHAAVALYADQSERKTEALARWLDQGQAKVALKVPSYDEMLALQARAAAAGLPNEVIHDAGRTQIAAGSATVLGIGPALASAIDAITGHLKLL